MTFLLFQLLILRNVFSGFSEGDLISYYVE